MIRFECVNPATNTDKFWQFEVLGGSGFKVRFTWGRNRTEGQSIVKSYGTYREMQATLEQTVKDKLSKGYLATRGNPARQVLPPTDAELEIERGLSRGIQKQRERDAEEIESAWRKTEERGGVRPRARDLGDPAFTISAGGAGGGGGGRGIINAMGGGGGGSSVNSKGVPIRLTGASELMQDALKGMAETMDKIMLDGRGPGGGVDWGAGFTQTERIRGGPRAGQPRRGPCPHPDLSKTMDGYVCRTCGKSVGPAAAPVADTVLTLKVKRKIVLDD